MKTIGSDVKTSLKAIFPFYVLTFYRQKNNLLIMKVTGRLIDNENNDKLQP